MPHDGRTRYNPSVAKVIIDKNNKANKQIGSGEGTAQKRLPLANKFKHRVENTNNAMVSALGKRLIANYDEVKAKKSTLAAMKMDSEVSKQFVGKFDHAMSDIDLGMKHYHLIRLFTNEGDNDALKELLSTSRALSYYSIRLADLLNDFGVPMTTALAIARNIFGAISKEAAVMAGTKGAVSSRALVTYIKVTPVSRMTSVAWKATSMFLKTTAKTMNLKKALAIAVSTATTYFIVDSIVDGFNDMVLDDPEKIDAFVKVENEIILDALGPDMTDEQKMSLNMLMSRFRNEMFFAAGFEPDEVPDEGSSTWFGAAVDSFKTIGEEYF